MQTAELEPLPRHVFESEQAKFLADAEADYHTLAGPEDDEDEDDEDDEDDVGDADDDDDDEE